MFTDISNTDDVINVSDITDRIEELESDRGDLEALQEAVDEAEEAIRDLPDDATEEDRESANDDLAGARKDLQEAEAWAEQNPDDAEEFDKLSAFLNDMQGYGGDHQWRGDWYPGYAIRESHFTDYCEEMVKDVGDLPQNIPGYLAIDWEKTADNLRVDYTESEFDGVTYLYR